MEDDQSPVRSVIDDEIEIPESSTYGQYTSGELREMLNEAIQNEDYEKASSIRDEIKKREK